MIKSSGNPLNLDTLRQINDGDMVRPSSEYVEKVRNEITSNCDELIEVGARIRPLMVSGVRVGWVRGFFDSERRRLSRWIKDRSHYLFEVFSSATTLSREGIKELSFSEIRSLSNLIQKMGEYDYSLFPYLQAFSTTLVSENLWHGFGTKLTSFENRVIPLPDGAEMKILTPSDHARLWASLCTYREQSKSRMDANWNALLTIRPLAGKSADPLANELKAVSKSLVTNSMSPWEAVVKRGIDKNYDDGYGHLENMDTREGMLKELYGMLNNDRHEQIMARFEKQQMESAEQQKKQIDSLHPGRALGINRETMVVLSEVDVRKRESELRKGRLQPRENRVHETQEDRIKKYYR